MCMYRVDPPAPLSGGPRPLRDDNTTDQPPHCYRPCDGRTPESLGFLIGEHVAWGNGSAGAAPVDRGATR